MKATAQRIAFIFLLLAALMLSASCTSYGDNTAYASGKVGNSGFEDGDSLWSISGAAALDDSCSHEEKQSLCIGSDDEYEAEAVQHINGLEPGYYYLEAYTLNEGNQEYCYIYANGSGQGKCMTAVPRSNDGSWVKVTVRGITVADDGIMEIGICSKGEGQYIHLDTFSIHYESDQTNQYENLFGGAVSWLDWVEDLGGRYYYSDGTEADALQIMAEYGCNIVRLELYNNPGDYVNDSGDTFPAGYKDADAIFDLAVRAHNKGMKIQLSFMYSDYWGNEIVPSDWQEKIEGIDDPDRITGILTDCLYDYTKGFMQRLADVGIYPEYVSLGNEMQGGILMPYSCTYGTQEQLDAFCSFMDAGYRAVKEVSADSRVVLHLSCNADDMFWESRSGTGVWFFGLCETNNIAYDVIGISYYPFWAQTDDRNAVKNALDAGDLLEWCNMMVNRFDKDILIMESGINWGRPGQLANNGAYTGIYTCTKEDQRNFMYELINAIKSVKDGRCVGDLYWDPVLVQQPGIGYAVNAESGSPRPNVVETTTFFGYDHKALPVLDAYRYNTVGTSEAILHGTVTDSSGKALAETTFTISLEGKEYSVTTDLYGDYILRVEAGKGELCVNGRSDRTVELAPGDRYRADFCIG